MTAVRNRLNSFYGVLAGVLVALAAGLLLMVTPPQASAATLTTDMISFISVGGNDAMTPEPAEGPGTLESPLTGAIDVSFTDEELAYLSVKFVDNNPEGTATYLVQEETPATLAAINLPTTNVDGRCNSDQPLSSEPGVYTIWVYAKESSAATTGDVFKLTLTITEKTAVPAFESFVMNALEGNTTARFTVANAEAYTGDVAVSFFTSEGGALPSGYSGVYDDGVLTVTMPEPITGETLLRVKFQVAGQGASDLSAVMVVYPYGTTPPAAPVFTSPVTANPGNETATILLTGPAYTGWTVVDVYGSDGFIVGGVAPTYDAETNTITLEFNPPLLEETAYEISMVVDELESPRTPLTVVPNAVGPAAVEVSRLWNPYNGAHLLSTDATEIATLETAGWKDERAVFSVYDSEVTGSTPVTRVYNPFNGDHLYSTSETEVADLVKAGWRDEGVKFYGSPETTYPVFRLWNSYQTADGGLGSHLWTADENEYNTLPDLPPVGAWKQEGAVWYAVSL